MGAALPLVSGPPAAGADRLAWADRHEHARPNSSGAERFAQRRIHQELERFGRTTASSRPPGSWTRGKRSRDEEREAAGLNRRVASLLAMTMAVQIRPSEGGTEL